MDRASAEQRDDFVARFFELKTALHGVAVVLGHVDGAFVAKEIGRVQQVDVQRVALDPFAAVDQPPQCAEWTST